ncbi:hypothetical protein Pla163_06200 [Planctomycetes bacterium Pla163]|uniref:Uncharacterized protein n=1 Tax=Rohdeia mirabilis TaxID=2528008 RepID=A0A518CWB4_9BACT|nr:hypothetical protein Pla163_06200 [Planctomycetes bacterium Pla163]
MIADPSSRPTLARALLGLAAAALLLVGCGDDGGEFARIEADAEALEESGPLGPVDLMGDPDADEFDVEDEDGDRVALFGDDEEASEAEEGTSDELVVRVITADGGPALAADVYLFEPRAAELERTLYEMGAGLAAEAFLERNGSRERTDDEGRVRVASFERAGLVGARAGGAWGSARVNAGQGEVTIVLEPDVRLLVRVVGSGGEPRVGVPVGLYETRRGRIRSTRVVETGEDGLAELLNPSDLFQLGRNDSEWRASLAVPLFEPPTVLIDPNALPEEPIELVLGPTASLRIELVEANGDPFSGRGTLTVSAEGSRSRLPFEMRVDGTASVVVPHLEPAVPLRIEFQREGSSADYDLDTLAPPVPDIEGEVRFVLVPSHPVLVARLVDETGEGLVDQRVLYRLRQATGTPGQNDRRGRDRDTGERAVTTDASGVLRVDLPDDWRNGELTYEGRVRTIAEGVDDSERAAIFELTGPLLPGDNDVGRVILSPPPTLIAGQVVDELGTPIEDASITLFLQTVDDEGRPRWNRIEDLEDRTGQDGFFRIVSWTPGTPLGVRASSRDHVRGEIVPFAAGAQGLVLELIGAGRIAGSLRVPDGVDARRFTVRAVAGTPRMDDLELLARDAVARTSPRRGNGEFELSRIVPGSYTVYVVYADLPEVLFALGGVEVEAGATTRDERLDPIDLTGVLRVFDLRFLQPDGDVVQWANVRWQVVGDDAWNQAQMGRDGRLSIVADADIIDVHAITRGVAPTLFSGVSRSGDLTFDPPLDVTVRIDESLVPDPELYQLSVTIEPVGWSGARTTAQIDARGRGRFASAGPGTYVVRYSVARKGRRDRGRTFATDPPERVELDPFAGEIVLRPKVPQQALERAVERAR